MVQLAPGSALVPLGLAICLVGMPVRSQEVCGNCNDDEATPDGVVECYDPECRTDPTCADSYVGNNDPLQTCGISITLRELWRAPRLSDTAGIAVGDIDRDGMPEVVYQNYSNVRVFSGLDGTQEGITNVAGGSNNRGPAIADVDGDGDGEIFVGCVPLNTPTYFMARLEHDLSVTWSTANTGDTCDAQNAYATASLADFDHDGTAEVYIMGFIIDSRDGRLLVDVSSEISLQTTSLTLAVDVLPDSFCTTCAGLELVTSYGVYGIDLATGVFSLEVDQPLRPRGTLAVVDWDGDQLLDVVTHANRWNVGGPGPRQIQAWNPRTGLGISPVYSFPAESSASVPAVADFDGDDDLEVAVIACDGFSSTDQRYVRVLDHDMSILRNIPVTENSSWTSIPAFDFDCDGIPELVHRGTVEISILSSSTGSVLASAPCASGTNTERVVIADIDADGHADLVAGCEAPAPDNGAIVAWTVPESPPARRVSNQYNYFNVNIDDDLKVPCWQQDHAEADVYPLLNSFLVQAPYFDVSGNVCVNPCLCGNGTIDPGEQCDDGNTTNGDGCQATCTLPRCGDGVLDPPESCDDGNADPTDQCSFACELTSCGDGIVQAPNGTGSGGPLGDGNEQCDDGNPIPGDGCDDCVLVSCVTAAIGPIRLLLAIKSADDMSVVMTHLVDVSADGYNTWYVQAKEEIPRARLGDLGTTPPGCGPSATTSCWHIGAVPPMPLGRLLFYQVRGTCRGTEAIE